MSQSASAGALNAADISSFNYLIGWAGVPLTTQCARSLCQRPYAAPGQTQPLFPSPPERALNHE